MKRIRVERMNANGNEGRLLEVGKPTSSRTFASTDDASIEGHHGYEEFRKLKNL